MALPIPVMPASPPPAQAAEQPAMPLSAATQPALALISWRCRRRRPRRKVSVPKGWMPTNRHRLTSWDLQRGQQQHRWGVALRWAGESSL